MASNKYNWGIISTGSIAQSFADGLKVLSDVCLYAVASRSLESAREFAARNEMSRAFGSYRELYDDKNVDIVYIGTPHNYHYQNVKDALNAGKNVLCEKALTLNATQAQELADLAREKNLFLMEAMWNRFQPWYTKVKEILEKGAIAEIDHVKAEFAVAFPFDPQHRIFNMKLAGGSLLDLGVYPIAIASLFLGTPSEIISTVNICQTGADDKVNMIFKYPGAKTAQLMCSSRFAAKNNFTLYGPLGFIEVEGPINRPQKVSLYKNNEDPLDFHCPVEGNGYNYEAQAVMNMLNEGKTEHPLMSLDESIEIMKMMDKIRFAAGIKYPEEE